MQQPRVALAYLSRIGIDRSDLHNDGIDYNNPRALRTEVERLLVAAHTKTILADFRQTQMLRLALGALLTDAEAPAGVEQALAELLAGVPARSDAVFEACLAGA